MNPKWRYFIAAILITIAIVGLATWIFHENGWMILGFVILMPIIAFFTYPEKRLFTRYFLLGILTSIPIMFIILLFLLSGIEC